jgi:uncharacterized protein YecE (DUF72 family)
MTSSEVATEPGALLVGTSGWQYADWKNVLYQGVPQRGWLERYAEYFGTVESNAAFYRLPTASTIERWRDLTPPTFVMAVKASRYLTHVRRLKEPEEPVKRMLEVIRELGPKLGPILLQLPPTLTADPTLLTQCLSFFPSDVRIAVEPRHDSWWTESIREILAEHSAALCWADRAGRPVTPLWQTTNWTYLRCHEGTAQPWPNYSDGELRSWADRVSQVRADGGDSYVYFNNDPGGAAIRNAIRFAALCGGQSPR